MSKAEHEHQVAPGSRPAGAQDAKEAARRVRGMFTAIAPRYDLLNHVLSLNVDRLWWRRTARAFAPVLRKPGARALDLCCGTGDMAFALRRQSGAVEIVGADFSPAMLQRAARKTGARRISWVEADALELPFATGSFDLVVSAFGFRNLVDYPAALREMARVLRPGGEAGLLDFSEPRGLFGRVYRVYFRRVLPAVGTVISGVRGPYAYLPDSVERFPPREALLEMMRAAGFERPSWTAYTFGIAGLFRGVKAG